MFENKPKNILSSIFCYIDHNMHESLSKGTLIDSVYTEPIYSPHIKLNSNKNNKNTSKAKLGVYFVNVRILNTNKQDLQYGYIYYPYLILDSLMNYLFVRNTDISLEQDWREPGPYCPIISEQLINKISRDRVFNGYGNTSASFIKNANIELKSTKSYTELFKYINKILYITKYKEMSNLVDLAFKKDWSNFIKNIMINPDVISELEPIFNYLAVAPHYKFKELYPHSDFTSYPYGEWKRNQQIALNAYIQEKVNLINSCLFVVEDINLFINEIKNKGYPTIKEGPQSLRGEVDEIKSFLSSIEKGYLDSLYNNYMYHVNELEEINIDDKKILHKSMFSARNMRKIARS